MRTLLQPVMSSRLLPAPALLLAAALLPAPSAIAAAPQDPLRSAECAQARTRLEAALDAASAKREGASARLAQTRREAIAVCLGGESAERQRSGAPQPAVTVAPANNIPRVNVVPPPVLAAPPAQLHIPRPATITACDGAGCWDSNGRYVPGQGPVLMGPRGACTAVAGMVACP